MAAAVEAAAAAAEAAAIDDDTPARSGLLDPQVLDALLCHPAMKALLSKDHKLVVALHQTSRQVQGAIAERCAGQVPVVLNTRPWCYALLSTGFIRMADC